LITNLGYGTVDAIQEYISIVLSNSVYPDHFQVTHEFDFDPTSAELRLRVLVPGLSSIPETKAYKYTKATDEITSTELPQKQCRDRYASAIHQVALRSIHEVFEADRRGLIKTISLEVGTSTIDPATGRETYVPFVIAGAEREAFLAFDLSAVVPALTLGRLGAAISKNPYGLVAAERSGVRRA
jgi:restriction system protein